MQALSYSPRASFFLFILFFFTMFSAVTYALTEADEPSYYGLDIYFDEWNQSNHTKNGFDWSMPDWVTPAENSAITHKRKIWADNYNGETGDSLLKKAGFRGNIKRQVSWSWRKLEPREGNYDFQGLRDEIDSVSENGKFKIELRIYGAVYLYERFFDDGSPRGFDSEYWKTVKDIEESAPKWLHDVYGIPKLVQKKYRNHRLTLLDEYNGDYHFRYKKMLNALKDSGILKDNRIMNVYAHIGSETRGEEGIGPKLDSPKRAVYEERHRLLADAMGDRRNLIIMSSFKSKDLKFAYDIGIGQRNGYVENYLMHVSNKDLGTYVDKNGYLEVDEAHPLIANNLASGDENEEYFFTELLR